VNSVAVSGAFTIVPPQDRLFGPEILTDGSFHVQFSGVVGQTYVLESSTDLLNWTPISTNTPVDVPFTLVDPAASAAPYRYYRVVSP
jgi:hypothetical protein